MTGVRSEVGGLARCWTFISPVATWLSGRLARLCPFGGRVGRRAGLVGEREREKKIFWLKAASGSRPEREGLQTRGEQREQAVGRVRAVPSSRRVGTQSYTPPSRTLRTAT